ncbi:MAG: hypothetical protein AB1704_00265 [Pseudomonadota bacterium]|jgi:hypothetical protein|uniref:hypothetical protein n=1 Tax=Burkholderiaceae TaxID=119060 RepID=UPI0010FA3AB1|nr:hypothetical protein [Burkholderia sp. 4M9327F10]
MTRLDSIRSYFVDQFFSTLINDPRMATLQYPAELFSSVGHFAVPSTVSGLTQIPTVASLDQLIATAPNSQKPDLQTFRAIELDALAAILPGLANWTSSWGEQISTLWAPVVNHPDGQDFFPVSMHDLLNYADAALTARFYSAAGQQPLSGQVYPLLFENPEVFNNPNIAAPLYESRQPFAATIGCAPPVTGFPADALDTGALNLGPALGRLGPGPLAPTLYAEIKGVAGALRLNQAYEAAALTGGQYAPLRNNRIHTDPLPAGGGAPLTAIGGNDIAAPRQPIMIVYHGFYPADDEARRQPGFTATNREFHHLGFGVMLMAPPPEPQDSDAVIESRRNGFLFACTGPDTIRMFPLDHPALKMVNDKGVIDPAGTHANVYFANMSPAGWEATFSNYFTRGQSAGAAWGEYLGAIGAGAAVGLIAGPIGAAVGAAVVAVVEILYWLFALFCALSGVCKSQGAQSQGGGPPVDDCGSTYTQSTNVLSPQGVNPQIGGPTRSFALELIPHFPDHNLYGFNAGGNGTISIENSPDDKEMLAWLAFSGGLGYQFDFATPGAVDQSGTSLRNYFDLFIGKYLEVEAARAQVSYFE